MTMLKITRNTLALAACIALLSAPSFADPLFAGVTSIEAKAASGDTQVIRLNADLPFQYTVKPLNDNQVVITLKNARLADNLVNSNGLLNITPGGAVSNASLGVSDNVTEEQIILNGPGLGQKTIVIEGETLQSTITSQEKAKVAFAPNTSNQISGTTIKPRDPDTPAYFSNQGMPAKPSWYQPDYNKYNPEPDPDNPTGEQSAGFLGLFKKEPTDNPTVASNKPSRFSFFTVVKNRPPTEQQVEQNLVKRIHTPPPRIPAEPAPRYNAPVYRDEPMTVLAVDEPARTTQPGRRQSLAVPMPKVPAQQTRVQNNGANNAIDLRMTAANAVQAQMRSEEAEAAIAAINSIPDTATPAVVTTAPGVYTKTNPNVNGPQIQSVTTMPYRQPVTPQVVYGQPNPYMPQPAPYAVTPYGDPSYGGQPTYQNQPYTYGGEPEYEVIEEVIEEPVAQAQPNYQMAKALPRYQGGSPPIQFTVSGYGATPGKVYTLPQPDVAANADPFNNDPAIAALAYASPAKAQERVNALMNQSLANFKAGKYELAEQEVSQALEIDQDNAELYAALAEIQLKQDRFGEAEAAYSQAVALDETKINPRYPQLLILAGKRDNAMTVLKDMAKEPNINDTDKAKVHYMLGTLYQENGEMLEAIGHLQAAARLSPKNADIQYNLGLAYEFQGDLAQAKTHYNKAVQLNPKAEDAKKALSRTSNALTRKS